MLAAVAVHSREVLEATWHAAETIQRETPLSYAARLRWLMQRAAGAVANQRAPSAASTPAML